MARIGFEERKGKVDEKIEIDRLLAHFFSQVLGIRSYNEIDTVPFPNINKKLYQRLNKYYTDV
jgi:hypothetical protein